MPELGRDARVSKASESHYCTAILWWGRQRNKILIDCDSAQLETSKTEVETLVGGVGDQPQVGGPCSSVQRSDVFIIAEG